jgi:hypothetical protein
VSRNSVDDDGVGVVGVDDILGDGKGTKSLCIDEHKAAGIR